MAEIAKLGMAVEATGVDEAREKLARLGATGRAAGGQLFYMGGAADDSSEKIGRADRANTRLQTSLNRLRPSLSLVVQEFGALGPTAQAASNLVTGFAAAVNPTTIAATALALTIGSLVSRWREYQQALKDTEETEARLENAFAKRGSERAKLSAEIAKEIRLNQSLDPELQAVTERYNEMSHSLRQAGASHEKLAEVESARSLATGKIVDPRRAAAAKEQAGIQQLITNLQFEQAALGAAASETIALNTAQRIQQALTTDLATKHGALTRTLAEETAALGRLQSAAGQIATGRQGIGAFEQNFGVSFDFNQEAAQRRLAANFVTVFQNLKNDPAFSGALQAAFSSLIDQLSAAGTKNIGGLLSSLGISPTEMSTLTSSLQPVVTGFQEVTREVVDFQRNVFGGSTKIVGSLSEMVPLTSDLRAEFEQSNQSLKDWGAGFVERQQRMAEAAANIGASMDRLDSAARNVDQTVARVIAGLDQLNGKTATAFVNVVTTGLPELEEAIRLTTGRDTGWDVFN